MKKFVLLLTTILLTLVLFGCGKTDSGKDAAKTDEKKTEEAKTEETKTEETKTDEAMKVAIVYSTGGLGDNSFNDAAKRGLELSKTELGIVYDEYEPKDPNAEAENQLRNYAQTEEYALIIATGFSMKDALLNVAQEFSEQKFAIIDERIEDLPNVASLSFKEHEGSFLMGALAAMMTKSNVVGYVGGAEAPLIQKFEVGYEQGAKYINPDIKVLTVYVGGTSAFNDPTSAKSKSEALISQNADVIYHASGASGMGVFEAAKEKGIFAIGVDSNQDGLAKGVILTSMIKKIDTAVVSVVKEVQDGVFEGKIHEYGLKEDGVGMTELEFTKDIVGEENLAKINELKEKISSGEIEIRSTK